MSADQGNSALRFVALLGAAIADATLVKLVLSKHHGEPADLQRVDARPIPLRGAPALSFTHHHTTRDVTRNLLPADALAAVQALLGANGFRSAHLLTVTHDHELLIGKRGTATLRSRPAGGGAQDDAAAADAQAHDRAKHRHVPLDRPFLHVLGVSTADGKLVPVMARKYRQIDKFVEVFANALAASPLGNSDAPVHVADFGSGKGYLTFAVHDHLRHALGRDAHVTGVELRADMAALGNAAAARLGLDGLRFEQGDIQRYEPAALDVMIALHACDTATDHAIHLGIRAGAAVLMCSPCCHKQIRPQLLSPQPIRAILQHGVHLGQEAEMVTDGLRALLLDACGYDTQVFEFVSLEHTSKNKMILAVKRALPKPAAEALAQIADVKRFYGIREQCLETLLRADGRLVP